MLGRLSLPTWLGRLGLWYQRFFSIDEIRQDKALQWFAGALLLAYAARFDHRLDSWILNPATTVEGVAQGQALCWPFFQSCTEWIVLSTIPYGYSQPTVFMLLFAMMGGAVYAMYRGRWAWVHAALLALLVARLYFMAINYQYKANYDYYHTIFTLLFVFAAQKRFFLQLAVVMFYVLSTSAKNHETWILGTYFSSMQTSLPIFGRGTEPLWTNLVIVMEMLGAWCLFSSRRWLQRSALTFFAVFHVYSGILVKYLYPITVLPPLLILFGPWFKPYRQVPLGRHALFGWGVIGLMLVGQTMPKLIPGDEKMTMEGAFYGLYMFDANHQCLVSAARNGQMVYMDMSQSAASRCDPYEYLFRVQQLACRGAVPAPVSLVIDHSINGGPFYRIVDAPNACALTFNPWGRNAWIRDTDTAPMVGRAVQNTYF
ncbi:MAG: hypothetical protein INF43_01975 [Alphaproteobacteria bacterium]|jgi:hypothetical protein|nr:hypothetical protein [Alphaproteobacteria bacterium]